MACQGEYSIGTAIADNNNEWILTVGYPISGDEVGVTATSSYSYSSGAISTSEFSACFYVNKNDECESAYEMYTDFRNVCEYQTFSFYHATPSSNPVSSCSPYIDTNPNDIWIKVNLSLIHISEPTRPY